MKDVPLGGERPGVRGFEIDGLAGKLDGKKPGDVVHGATASWPSTSTTTTMITTHDDEARGARAPPRDASRCTLAFTIKEIKRRELPEVDDAFAQGGRRADRPRPPRRDPEEARRPPTSARPKKRSSRSCWTFSWTGRPSRWRRARSTARSSRASSALVLERMIRGESEDAARAAVEADRDKIREIVERDAKAWLHRREACEKREDLCSRGRCSEGDREDRGRTGNDADQGPRVLRIRGRCCPSCARTSWNAKSWTSCGRTARSPRSRRTRGRGGPRRRARGEEGA